MGDVLTALPDIQGSLFYQVTFLNIICLTCFSKCLKMFKMVCIMEKYYCEESKHYSSNCKKLHDMKPCTQNCYSVSMKQHSVHTSIEMYTHCVARLVTKQENTTLLFVVFECCITPNKNHLRKMLHILLRRLSTQLLVTQILLDKEHQNSQPSAAEQNRALPDRHLSRAVLLPNNRTHISICLDIFCPVHLARQRDATPQTCTDCKSR